MYVITRKLEIHRCGVVWTFRGTGFHVVASGEGAPLSDSEAWDAIQQATQVGARVLIAGPWTVRSIGPAWRDRALVAGLHTLLTNGPHGFTFRPAEQGWWGAITAAVQRLVRRPAQAPRQAPAPRPQVEGVPFAQEDPAATTQT